MKRIIITTLLILLFVGAASASITNFWSSLFGEASAPELIAAQADPIKVRPGDNLKTIVEIEDQYGIAEAKAFYFHEKGFDEVPMTLTASMPNNRYTFTANWEVHDTLDQKWYETLYVITNTEGKTLEGMVKWQDPTVSHSAAQVQPGTFPAGTFTFPGTVDTTYFECTDCINNSQIDATDLSISCTETFSSVTTGTNGQEAIATVQSGYTLVSGGCQEGIGAGTRWLTINKKSGASQWYCRSDDGAGSVTSSLQAYALGCRIQ